MINNKRSDLKYFCFKINEQLDKSKSDLEWLYYKKFVKVKFTEQSFYNYIRFLRDGVNFLYYSESKDKIFVSDFGRYLLKKYIK